MKTRSSRFSSIEVQHAAARPSIAAAVVVSLFLIGFAGAVHAQTITMKKKCREPVAAANQMSDTGDFAAALAALDAVIDKCKTNDGKEAVQVGRARALNGQERYSEAIAAAEAAQAARPKSESLDAYFEKAYAEEQMGNTETATADYNRIIELTEKNQNVTERATIYAKVADLKQKSGNTAEAQTYLTKAMELDPSNGEFRVLQGDWAVRAGDYDAAFAAYDRAVAMGSTGAEMYEIRTEARMKQVQDKYGTTNAQELRGQMTPTETKQLCSELTKALELGLINPKLDMFSALVCK